MFDASKWAVNNLLEDFLKKPIKVTIENISDKYVITGTLQVSKTKNLKNDKQKPKTTKRKTNFAK